MPDNEPNEDLLESPAHRLRRTCTACRLSLHRWGVSKSVTTAQKDEIATHFGAEKTRLRAGKQLINTKNEHYAAVIQILNDVKQEWEKRTLPYVEDGVRLIQNDKISLFDDYVQNARASLEQAVSTLRENWSSLVEEARRNLGTLFNAADYQGDISLRYAIGLDFPSVEPPSYLRAISPAIYEEQAQRVAARFDQALALAEDMFMGQLNELVTNLAERLSPDADGNRRVFRDVAITNVQDFVRRFRQLYVGDNAQLEQLVSEAEQILTTNTPDGQHPTRPAELRNVDWMREQAAAGMRRLSETLSGMVSIQSRRRLSTSAASRVESGEESSSTSSEVEEESAIEI